jgi:hypothetical protein
MYRAKWVRNGGKTIRSEGEGDGRSLLGTLDFEESKRNIVFRNVNRVSEEEWEEVRERKRRFGQIVLSVICIYLFFSEYILGMQLFNS